ncbi:hypothetical protein [Candidatus Nitrosotalea sp. TS]|nr:hypothetical protein [Candidatus Nitrosotalea sp. TS]
MIIPSIHKLLGKKILSFTVDLGQIESEKKRTSKQIDVLNAAIKEIESR